MAKKLSEYEKKRDEELMRSGEVLGLTFGLLDSDGAGVLRWILQDAIECRKDADAHVKSVLIALTGMCDRVVEINEECRRAG